MQSEAVGFNILRRCKRNPGYIGGWKLNEDGCMPGSNTVEQALAEWVLLVLLFTQPGLAGGWTPHTAALVEQRHHHATGV